MLRDNERANHNDFLEERMTVVNKTLVINAPLDVVRSYYADQRYARQIYQNVYLWEPDEEWPNAGATAKIGFKTPGMNVEGTSTSQEYEPQLMRHVYRVDGKGVEPSHWEWSFKEMDGQTTVDVQVEYHIPGSILGQALDKLFVERQNARLLQQSLDNLKALAEGSAG
ncbi:MAG: SRPBCC family protein [Chloroflexota bacterium]